MCFSGKNFFDLTIKHIYKTRFLFISFKLTRGPRSDVKTGLELKCNLSLEHVDKSLVLIICVTPPFWVYLYRVVHTPSTSSSRTFNEILE
jgi:hypothetical protein